MPRGPSSRKVGVEGRWDGFYAGSKRTVEGWHQYSGRPRLTGGVPSGDPGGAATWPYLVWVCGGEGRGMEGKAVGDRNMGGGTGSYHNNWPRTIGRALPSPPFPPLPGTKAHLGRAVAHRDIFVANAFAMGSSGEGEGRERGHLACTGAPPPLHPPPHHHARAPARARIRPRQPLPPPANTRTHTHTPPRFRPPPSFPSHPPFTPVLPSSPPTHQPTHPRIGCATTRGTCANLRPACPPPCASRAACEAPSSPHPRSRPGRSTCLPNWSVGVGCVMGLRSPLIRS
jgi:hypothetical protein